MFEKVLFATDFSEYARKTLDCLSDIPGVREVILLHVVDATYPSKRGWTHGPAIASARIELEEQKQRLEGHGIRTRAKVEVITAGDVAGAILKTAEEEHVTLIFMGARGRGIVQGILLGSVSRSVLRYARQHVLIMRHRVAEEMGDSRYEKFCQSILSKLLYPTDFSEPAQKTASLLKGMQGVEKVVLAHVVTQGETQEEIQEYVHAAEQKLDEARKSFDTAGIGTDIRVRLGSPSDEIIRLAEEEDVSLIVMSRHGQGWLRELVLGSTTYLVAKRTKRPILVVHQD
ncbi:MAG: universal stress protein [Methanomicrobiales archaeon]|nr:universal stress protein [Methanomicrobiales archaeon]MDI6876906.1 universal stress protein [Methanomicrobiales archaeon]